MTESDIQIQVVEYLELVQFKFNFLFFSVSNEAMGKARTGGGLGRMARLKKMGLRHGVADLVIVKDGSVYFLEMKKPGGIVSDHQKQFAIDCFRVFAYYETAFSFDEAMEKLELWGILE